jgi:hypothetical protein
MVRGMRTEIVVTECTSVSVPYARPCSSSCAERRTVRSENEIQQVGRGLSLSQTRRRAAMGGFTLDDGYVRRYCRRSLLLLFVPLVLSSWTSERSRSLITTVTGNRYRANTACHGA